MVSGDIHEEQLIIPANITGLNLEQSRSLVIDWHLAAKNRTILEVNGVGG